MSDNEMRPVAWGVPNSRPTEEQPLMQLLHSTKGCQYPELLVPLYTRPALTDEQVREIAEKWSQAWRVDRDISMVGCIESAIREAMDRGGRG